MDDVDHKIAALQSQIGRLQAEVIALRISGSYAVHALTAAVVARGLVTPCEVAALLETYANGFDSQGGKGRGPEASTIRTEVAETLKRQAAEVMKVVAASESPRAA
jgi:hypothetical protein